MFDWPSCECPPTADDAIDVRRMLQLPPFAARPSSPSGGFAFDGGIDQFGGVAVVLLGDAAQEYRIPRRQKKACEMSERGTTITVNFSGFHRLIKLSVCTANKRQ
jgi:hypothetical protein